MVLGLSCDEIKIILVVGVVMDFLIRSPWCSLSTKIEINLEFSKAFVRGIIVCTYTGILF